ncbi:MAG TPA: hypothetical protein VI670_27745 [Thermoanaerobaculia bacterium]|jgi:hypothetical protein
MDFLAGTWDKIKGAASDVYDWVTRSPIDDFKAGYQWGKSVSDTVTQAATRTVTNAARAAGSTVGKATSGLVWEALIPLIPLIVIVGAGYYFLRRRGA